MKIVRATDEGLIAVREKLLSGGVAVIPTDTVYGLAAHPDHPAAVERLYTIKQRLMNKPIALLASSDEAVSAFLKTSISPLARRLAEKHWPGALTIVLGGEGFRVPAHEWTRKLIASCGGVLRVSSANLAGKCPALDATAALADVGLSADIVVDDGLSAGGTASSVIRIEGENLEVLREGPVKFLRLASSSPRRAKILRRLDVDFTIEKREAKEVAYPCDPERTVRENALAKGGSGHILSADTILWHENRIYGKPRDLEEARRFLRELSGKTHTVYTGVAYDGEVKVVTAYVKFRELDDETIEEYVERVRPLDRAGAYDIDEAGDILVESFEGEYENIMGLPIGPLKEWGIVR